MSRSPLIEASGWKTENNILKRSFSGDLIFLYQKELELASDLPKHDHFILGRKTAVGNEFAFAPGLRTLRSQINHNIEQKLLDNELVFDLFKQAISLLEPLHASSKIHCGISPFSLLLSENNQLKLTQWASVRSLAKNDVHDDHWFLPDLVNYIAPEQSGKTKHKPSYSADIYSLGAVMYELATGHQAVRGEDITQTIYQHLTLEPSDPIQLNPKLCKALSQTILKCLSKNPNSRYQSLAELKRDLEVAEELFNSGELSAALPESDQLKERSFDLEAFNNHCYSVQLEKLVSVIEDKIGGSDTGVCFIEGGEGSGKEFLITNAKQTVQSAYTVFLSVRLENDGVNPLQSIKQVLDGLTDFLLVQPEDQLQIFSNILIEKLGLALPSFLKFYPRLSVLLHQSELLEKPKEDNANLSNQLSFAFSSFLDAFFQLNTKLVLCFQNLDKVSSNTFQVLLGIFKEFELNQLFVVFTQSDSVNLEQTKVLRAEVEELITEPASNIILRSLTTPEITNALLQSGLEPVNANECAPVMQRQSGGQFYFLNQLLERLLDNAGIGYDERAEKLKIDSDKLHELHFNFNNVADYFENIFKDGSFEEQRYLMVAAAFGNSFSPRDVEFVLTQETAEGVLDLLVSKHLVQLLNADNHEFRFVNANLREVILRHSERTINIQIIQAFDNSGKTDIGNDQLLKISPILLQLKDEDIRTYSHLIEKASIAAQAVSAFDLNFNLLSLLISVVDKKDWKERYEYCVNIHTQYLHAVSLHSQTTEIDHLFSELKLRVNSKIGELMIYEAYGEALLARQNFSRYIENTTFILKKYGITISTEPTLPRIIFMMVRTQMKMKGKGIEAFESLPAVSDSEAKHMLKLTLTLIGAAYVVNPKMVPELVYQQLAQTFRYGLSSQISNAISSYAFLVSNFTNKHDDALEIQQISNALNVKYGNALSEITCDFLFTCFVANWHKDIREVREDIHAIFIKSRQLGLVNIAFYNLTFYIVQSFTAETPLSKVEADIEHYLPIAKNLKQETSVTTLSFALFFVKAIVRGEHSVEECTEYFDKLYKKFSAEEDITNLAFSVQLFNVYLNLVEINHNLPQREESIAVAKKALGAGFHGFVGQEFELSIQYSLDGLSKHKKRLKSIEKEFETAHKQHATNHAAKYSFVRGLNALHKDQNLALTQFLKSYEIAHSREYYLTAYHAATQIEKIYRHLGLENLAATYLKHRLDALIAHDAHAMANALLASHPELADSASLTSENLRSSQIDLMSFIKASNSISGEIKLDHMLVNLILVLIENAGAQNAGFVTNKNDGLYELASKMNSKIISTKPMLCDVNRYPMSILRYCFRSAKVVIEESAEKNPLFSNDPYIKKNKIKSIFCLPVIKNKEIAGVIYLENNSIEGAFTQDRVQTLELLASQVAVSLENAMLYDEMEQKVEHRTRELNDEKTLVETKNKEITDSIVYAKRIQTAILPSDRAINQYLPNSFIFYRPKDIVAGDFYWMERWQPQPEAPETIMFAAADCTGHGVPGAMVSVICNNGLNRSVREYGLSDPGEILDMTRDIVVKEFEKSEDEVNDGMDIALVTITRNIGVGGAEIKYAGANNPLWVVRKGSSEIEQIKANKQPIGQYAMVKPFSSHTLQLNQGDTIYLFSDGYMDQFGGSSQKKFKSSRLRALISSIQGKTMEEQHQLVTDTFYDWKGDLEQIDDVCLVGIMV